MPLSVSGADKQSIALYARQLGFELFGVTGPEAPAHFDVFSRWIADGKHGQMEYLAVERSLKRRRDPLLIMPECRSILVLGTPYWAPNAFTISDDPDRLTVRGQIAAYAWGLDYHAVLKERMEALVEHIRKLVGKPFLHRIYSDTGPLLERELAQRAGLGWIGKNTCLINPRLGSYLFLSEILLDLELEPDGPFTPDHCGTCTRCWEACPTRCILLDRTIDAPRCISYLTIELKGSIPADLRPMLSDRVFGCDICQEVCPWNKDREHKMGDRAFAPVGDAPRPDLICEMGLTAEAFSLNFSENPRKRARRAGYLRNVAVCLGNSHNPHATLALGRALLDHEPVVRSHTAWALGEIGGDNARFLLAQAEERESDPIVREEILSALAKLPRWAPV